MIRPEAAETLKRWAEPALAVGATLTALWLVGAPTLQWSWLTLVLSVAILFAGAVWLRAALRRMQLAYGDGERGRVFVEERRILYVGAFGNRQIGADELSRVELASSGSGGAVWMLSTEVGPPAAIPADAEGAGALFDFIAALPGVGEVRLERAMRTRRDGIATVWRRS